MRYKVVYFIDKRCLHDCQTVTLGFFMSIKSRYSMLPVTETRRNECNVGDLGILKQVSILAFFAYIVKNSVGKSYSITTSTFLAIPGKFSAAYILPLLSILCFNSTWVLMATTIKWAKTEQTVRRISIGRCMHTAQTVIISHSRPNDRYIMTIHWLYRRTAAIQFAVFESPGLFAIPASVIKIVPGL